MPGVPVSHTWMRLSPPPLPGVAAQANFPWFIGCSIPRTNFFEVLKVLEVQMGLTATLQMDYGKMRCLSDS